MWVGICNQCALLILLLHAQGELSEPVKTEDCLWNFEGGVVDITLQKLDGMHWWSCVIKVGMPPSAVSRRLSRRGCLKEDVLSPLCCTFQL